MNVRVSTRVRFTQLSRAVKNGVPPPTRTGCVTNAYSSINPARTTGPMLVQQILGGEVSWQQWPVYVVAELLAGVAAAVMFGFIAHTAQDGATSHTTAPAEPIAAEV